jgi:hypothetical protein
MLTMPVEFTNLMTVFAPLFSGESGGMPRCCFQERS